MVNRSFEQVTGDAAAEVQGCDIARPMPAEQVGPWQRQCEAAPRWRRHAAPQQGSESA